MWTLCGVLFLLLMIVGILWEVVYRIPRRTARRQEPLENKSGYSVEAIKEGTRQGLQSQEYRDQMMGILEARLVHALNKDDVEATYACAAGIEALASYGRDHQIAKR